MALPIRPQQGLPVKRPDSPVSEPAEELATELPDLLPEPMLPSLEEVTVQPASRVERVAPAKPQQQVRKPAPVAQPKEEALPEGWAIDPVTGKRFKQIAGYKPGVMKSRAAVKAASNGGMSLDQLRATVNLDPDFDLDNLNGSAETFLAHLRVPPNKEEQQELLRLRAAREEQFAKAAARAAEDDEDDE